jgi:DNA topoisomerase 2-associated protein PAT1
MSLLTTLISRAELVKQSSPEMNPADWEQWMQLYNRLFDTVEPVLPLIFPGSVNDTEDVYVWHFLAAMGVGASPEQQQRLVLGVKDRVMDTVAVSKALPAELASVRLGHVNLFMRAIGLDVELLG